MLRPNIDWQNMAMTFCANRPGQIHLRVAVRTLHAGGVVAYPTEAVFGLGCDPFDQDAVMRLLAIKQRSVDKGLVVVAAAVSQLAPLWAPLAAQERALLAVGWPGPNTWVIPNRDVFPPWITGGRHQVAVRVSAHPAVQALCTAFGGALVSTSANVSGHAPARSSLAVRMQFANALDYIVPGAVGAQKNPTQIRDLATGLVLRSS